MEEGFTTEHRSNRIDETDEKKRLRIDLPVDLHLQLHRLKLLEGTTMSAAVENALRRHLGREEAPPDAAVREAVEEARIILPDDVELEVDAEPLPAVEHDADQVAGLVTDALGAIGDAHREGLVDGSTAVDLGTKETADAALVYLQTSDPSPPVKYLQERLDPIEADAAGGQAIVPRRVVQSVTGGSLTLGQDDDGGIGLVLRFPTGGS